MRKWTKEKIFEEAKKYTTLREFEEKSKGAYLAAYRNGYLNELTWLEKKKKKNGYWNYENCYNAAKRCETLVEFEKKYGGAHFKARKMKWIDDYTWFKKRAELPNKNEYLIYAYLHNRTKSVYVGLTTLSRIENRHKEHKIGRLVKGIRRYDVVYNFFCEIGEEIPRPIILRKSLTAEEAKKMEEYYKKQYEKKGWNALNIAKCGSLGMYSKWNNNNCREESKKYKNRSEFKKNNPSAYNYAKRNKLLKSYTWLENGRGLYGYWNYERCYEESKKYEYIGDFSKYNASAYQSALRHKWLKDYVWLKRRKI